MFILNSSYMILLICIFIWHDIKDELKRSYIFIDIDF